jgi:drug/metabolite transporter (DMT)-like permease
MPTRSPRGFSRLGFAAVLAGATGIGFAPILVRFSQVGPSATASFRILFALPLLGLLLGLERRKSPDAVQPSSARDFRMLALAGLLFAADLSIWHWSLQFTTVANSTLLTNFAPVFVTLGARVFLGEKISARFVAGLALALLGALLLVRGSFSLSAGNLLGDGLALAGAVFYGGYLLSVKFLRRSLSTVAIMAWSGLVSCPTLFLAGVLSGERVLPPDARGWGVLLALALISHVGGQTLIAYALGHLPASFSALSLLWQPVVAAFLAWPVLHEPISAWQAAGGSIILAGIALASGMLRRSADME